MNQKSPFIFALMLIFSATCLMAAPIQRPSAPISQVDQDLSKAQNDFEVARKMFNPYYAGPLLTPSAHNVPPGHFNVQPYVFVTNTFAEYNGDRKSVNITDTWQVKPIIIMQAGLLNWLDLTVTAGAIYNSQGDQDAFNATDTQVEFGFQIMKEQPYRPAIRVTLSQNFPSGKYQKLNSKKEGIDATGNGTYGTSFSLNFTKVIWWVSTHPFSLRASLNYTVPYMVSVQGFNAYGGGFGTRGKVNPGNGIAIDTSIELSLTQKWVFAVDLVYTYQNKSSFSGHRGRTASGDVASVGGPSNDSLSCAPAIEYNPTANMGFLAGVWFTVTGRNSADFISGILTMTYYW